MKLLIQTNSFYYEDSYKIVKPIGCSIQFGSKYSLDVEKEDTERLREQHIGQGGREDSEHVRVSLPPVEVGSPHA